MKQKGFTLVEIMVVVAILGVLAAIAIPMMSGNDVKARRAIAKSTLLEVSSKQEEYFINNKSYTALLTDLAYPDPFYIDDNGVPVPQANSFYQISMVATSVTYTIMAVPLNRQLKDSDCATLSVSNTGFKTATGTKKAEGCW